MSKRRLVLAHAEARRRAIECVTQAPDGYIVEVSEPTRNLEQNALMWVWLQAFAD
ncbi:MAG: recombination protein NinB, partial [Burkholderiaceae bacterium]